jgi:hypothetical protein
MTHKPLAHSRKRTSHLGCVSGTTSFARVPQRQSKVRAARAGARARCIAYSARTGARCGRLACDRGWRAPLFLCRQHGQGLAALEAMLAGESACRRVALTDWRFAWEVHP